MTAQLSGEYFTAPDPEAFPPGTIRIDSETGHVCGYLPSDGVFTENFHADTVETTTGPVRVGPLHYVHPGEEPPPHDSAEMARGYYSTFTEVIGWIAVGRGEAGIWVAGAITAPYLSCRDRAVLALAGLQADIRPRPSDDDEKADELCALHLTGTARDVPALATREMLTKADLLQALTTGHLADVPDDAPIVVGTTYRDEGPGHTPLAGITQAMYSPTTIRSGEIYPTDEDVEASDHYDDADRPPLGAVPAISFTPFSLY